MVSHEEILLRLITAAVLGGLVGLERERLEWVAGLRTHMLVSLGAALIMIVSAFGFNDLIGHPHVTLDPSRIAAQVVSGIGFLGAGTILFLRQKVIRGLTTAASLWTVAGVGLAVGCGLYVAAICTVVLVLLILAAVKPVERRLFRRDQPRQLTLTIDRNPTLIARLEAELVAAGIETFDVAIKRDPATVAEDELRVMLPQGVTREVLLPVVDRLRTLEGVSSIRF
jgi:putative Mg2+ transporter-C (MgtC) family protein